MRAAATAFMHSLDASGRRAALFAFDDPERFAWQYTPGARGGLALERMDGRQRDAAMRLLESGLSERGAATAREIIGLEPVLRAVEEAAGRPGADRRNPLHYWLSVFGDPAAGEPWAWRVGGHHLCLHYTVIGDATSVTPLFFGANPARVPPMPSRHPGYPEGSRVLAAEEDLARALLGALEAPQRSRAVVSDEAPGDILTRNAVRAEIAAVPTGIGYADLTAAQRERFDALLRHYLDRVRHPPPIDAERLSFAWAGSTEPGAGHYYAVRGDSFLLEYDNTQDDANHVHTVWRDLHRDWGEDLLAAHYRHAH